METMNAKEAQRPSLRIPSSIKGEDRSRRQWRPEVRVSAVEFSPTGTLTDFCWSQFSTF